MFLKGFLFLNMECLPRRQRSKNLRVFQCNTGCFNFAWPLSVPSSLYCLFRMKITFIFLRFKFYYNEIKRRGGFLG